MVQFVPVNIPPVFTAPNYHFIVTQCGPPGVILGTIHAVDANVANLGQVSYSTPDEYV